MNVENKTQLIMTIQNDIAKAEAKLKEAQDRLKEMQDKVFLLRVEANALIQEAYSRPNGVNDAH
jgi:F0F1-type ATP synthase membrane subunit b/b'